MSGIHLLGLILTFVRPRTLTLKVSPVVPVTVTLGVSKSLDKEGSTVTFLLVEFVMGLSGTKTQNKCGGMGFKTTRIDG